MYQLGKGSHECARVCHRAIAAPSDISGWCVGHSASKSHINKLVSWISRAFFTLRETLIFETHGKRCCFYRRIWMTPSFYLRLPDLVAFISWMVFRNGHSDNSEFLGKLRNLGIPYYVFIQIHSFFHAKNL